MRLAARGGGAMSYHLADTSAEKRDLGVAIQGLINTNLDLLNTCFLAEIVGFSGNRVNVTQVVRKDSYESEFVLSGVLVAFACSGLWQTQFKLKIGDIGLCLVNNRDLSLYKQNGKKGLAPTSRVKDLNDSVFLPLSMFKTLDLQSGNDYTITSSDGNEISFKSGSLKINANADINASAKNANFTTSGNFSASASGNFSASAKGNFSAQGKSVSVTADADFKAKATSGATIESPTTTINSPAITLGGNVAVSGGISMGGVMTSASGAPISVGNASGTLGACFDAVFAAMDLLASGMKGNATEPSAYSGGKSALQATIKGVVL